MTDAKPYAGLTETDADRLLAASSKIEELASNEIECNQGTQVDGSVLVALAREVDRITRDSVHLETPPPAFGTLDRLSINRLRALSGEILTIAERLEADASTQQCGSIIGAMARQIARVTESATHYFEEIPF